MKRVWIAALFLAPLLGTSACSESVGSSNRASSQLMQVSSVHWEELAAAEGAARVTNNGLIMMR